MKKRYKLRIQVKLALVAILLSLVCVVGTTLAYLLDTSSAVTNTFNPAFVDCEVQSDSSIKNISDIDAYIRADVVVTWKDAQKNIYYEKPEVTLLADDANWTKNGDYYYYNGTVSPGNSTSALIKSVEAKSTAPEGYTLSVEIIAEAIQGDPEAAVQEAWGYAPAGN